MAGFGASQFGRYELRGQLGRGGFAQVYRAWDTLLFREVALKALLPHLAEEEGVRTRFLNEARALARLRHQAIVTVFDVGEVDGRPYFTMELVEGHTLAALYPSGRMIELEALLPVLGNVAGAVDYLHLQGFVHRDIKPANIMIDNSGRALLMDFGIARALNELGATLTGTSVGTPEYMAPEQVRGQPVGPEADVYALGVLVYRLLAGRAPFVGDTAAVLVGHATEPPPPLREFRQDLPERVHAAVAAALAKDPAQRPASATAFYELLARPSGISRSIAPQDGVATESIVVPPRLAGPPPLSPANRRPLLLAGIIAAVLVVLAAAGAGAYAFIIHKPTPTPVRAATTVAPTVAPTAPPTVTTVATVATVPPTREPVRTQPPASVPSATRQPEPSVAPTQAPSAPAASVTAVRTVAGGTTLVVSRIFGAALRVSPDSNAGILAVLQCGRSLNELGEESGWYQVSDGSQSGWVGAARVAAGGTAVDCRGAMAFQVNSMVVVQVASGCLSLRDAPARDAHFSQCSTNGTVYRVTGGPMEVAGEDWIPVSNPTDGSGWMLAVDLRPAG